MTSPAEDIRTFQGTLAQPLNFGHILEICGKVHQDADRIAINFSQSRITCNSIDNNNNSRHLQILFDFIKKHITFGQFGQTNNNNDNDCVITKDLILAEFLNEFKLYIMLGETKFHIALNNKPMVNFIYKENLEKLQIQSIEVLGKLEYLKQLDHHKYFPHVWPPIQIIDDYLDFSNDQPMSFRPGHIMTITLRLEGNCKGRFIIQFRHARDNKRQELHISVRFDTKKIIRNSKCRQADDKLAFDDEEVDGFTFLFSRFGPEEIDDGTAFPFEDFNKPFKLAVGFCATEFRVAKDGQFLFKFSYRSPNVLRYIMGPKIFGTNGLNVRVWGVEHFVLEDEFCKDFEKYSI